jgi:hypothetical protein
MGNVVGFHKQLETDQAIAFAETAGSEADLGAGQAKGFILSLNHG